MQMQTRKKYEPGYYFNLINRFGDLSYNELDHNKKKKHANMNINGLIKSINFHILTKLRSSRKQTPNIIIKLSIESKIYNFLKNNFGMNHRYRECDDFLSKYSIESSRCKNARYYSVASNFEFKIARGRKLKYNQLKSGKVIKRVISANPILYISFFLTNFP